MNQKERNALMAQAICGVPAQQEVARAAFKRVVDAQNMRESCWPLAKLQETILRESRRAYGKERDLAYIAYAKDDAGTVEVHTPPYVYEYDIRVIYTGPLCDYWTTTLKGSHRMNQPEPRTVVPLYSSAYCGYREWETVQEGTRYTIVENKGVWSVLRFVDGCWVDAPEESAVDAFLARYNLVLE